MANFDTSKGAEVADEMASSGSSHGHNGFPTGSVDDKKLVRKIDFRLVPILCVIYITSFIDRINIGNALLFKLGADLHMTSNQANIALAIFFVSYVTFEIPANILMKKIKPHIFMPACMLVFGFVVTMQGFVQNFAGLLVTRFIMGIAEAGTFPGSFYLMSMWYRREEAQTRFSFFYNAASFAGAFGGLLATGIGHMDGIRGWHAWRWIFILEGLATCLLSVVVYFILPDFPEDAHWLSQDEKACVIERLREDHGESEIETKISIAAVVESFKDFKMVITAIMYLGPAVSGYGLAYFIPTIVATFGYSPIQSQLYSVPPWAATFVWSMLVAYASDKTKKRFPYIVLGHLVALAGVVTLFTLHHNKNALYAALCLYLMGVISVLPIMVCWNVMNLHGHKNRAIGSAWQIGIGNCAGLIAPFAWPAKDKPRYKLGYELGISFLCISLALSTLYFVMCIFQNRSRSGKKKLLL